MTLSRKSLLVLAVAAALPLAGAVHSQSAPKPPPAPAAPAAPAPPTAAQQKEIDAARADLERAAKRLAELTGHRIGPGFAPHFARDGGLPARPVIGVLLAPDADAGVRIAGVTPDGAAAAAGLKAGDRLLRIGGKPIAGATPEARVAAARALLQGTDEKTAVTLAYARDGREAQVSVTPKLDQRIMVFTGDGGMLRPGGNVIVRRIEGVPGADGRRIEIETMEPGPGAMAPGAMPIGGDAGMAFAGVVPGAGGVEHRVIRIECRRGDRDCNGQRPIGAFASQLPDGELRLLDAFRWNGLNLASVDAKLGRYFGTDRGVLVLSAGPALAGLEPGDVIQRVDGKRVDTPREVMDALRGKPADSRVPVDYLRERKAASAKITVPQTMPIGAMPLPPMPPMPSIAPMAPLSELPPMPPQVGATPAVPAAPLPPPPPARVD